MRHMANVEYATQTPETIATGTGFNDGVGRHGPLRWIGDETTGTQPVDEVNSDITIEGRAAELWRHW